jgi:ribosomal protein L11 methyltransferase
MPEKSTPRHIQRWVRHASAAHEDAWRERLAFLGTGLVIHIRPGTKLLRLEGYASGSVLRQLRKEFGGKLERIDTVEIATRANAPRRPLRIVRDLAIIDTHGSWPATKPKPRILLRITGAMAFGTGEHATTAACLRFLRDEAGRADQDWTLLDIGTGSGILAIAAEKLGAKQIDAFDYDERAFKAARANMLRNRCRRIKMTKTNLLRWKPRRTYPLVVANVFSEILRLAAPQITSSVRPGGYLIISGILRPQEQETLGTFLRFGLQLEAVSRRGKWVTLKLRSPQSPTTSRKANATKRLRRL